MDYRNLRKLARDNLSGMWGLAIAVAAIAALLGAGGTSFLPDLEYIIPTKDLFSLGENFHVSVKTGVFTTLAFLFGGTIELGYCLFLLKLHDQKKPEFNDLFSQFDRFGTGFAQYFLRNMYTFFWSLLFIIPGVVKAYAYAMTPFILTDHPELTASEAITRSKQMMDGHKGELFMLELTFLGWGLLASICANVGYLFLNPYIFSAKAAFYRQLLAQEQAQRVGYTYEA